MATRPIAPWAGSVASTLPPANSRCCWMIPKASVRDPQVHYDATRILFLLPAWRFRLFPPVRDQRRRQRAAAAYHGPLRRLRTHLPARRPNPVLLQPLQSLGELLVHAGRSALHLRRTGTAHRPISANIEQDNAPWPMSDGRVIYTRWEYVDRSRVAFHHLWTANPDGTGQMVYFGNQHPGTVMIDAKPIPGARPGGGDLLARARQAGACRDGHPRQSQGRPRRTCIGPADQQDQRLPRSVPAVGRTVPGGPGPATCW